MIKIGDKLLCKKNIDNIFIKNKKYKVDNVVANSTVNTTLPKEYWYKVIDGKIDSANYLAENFFYTINVKNYVFSSFDIFDVFYTKQEERRMKLKSIEK